MRARAGQGQGANVARWRGMVGDNGELAEAEIKGVRQLLQERGFEGGVPELRVLGWERQRLKPEAPEQPGGRLSFATALADDLAVKSKARLTWKSYAAWFNCFVAFCESFGVSTSWAADRAHVYAEVLRLSVAMMHLCYSMSTIEIYVTAVCVMLRVRGVSSPREVETFRMTMEGVARELGKAKQKKPPVEPHHVAAILVSPRPAAFDELRWLQAKVVLLVGWELFVRRQDLPRLQPCDLRITQEGMHVLIRYAKNDQKGLTRAPFLQRHEDSRACPVALMEHYLRATEIRVCEGCDKVWGEPFRCLQCPSLFPSITPTGAQTVGLSVRAQHTLGGGQGEPVPVWCVVGCVSAWGEGWGFKTRKNQRPGENTHPSRCDGPRLGGGGEKMRAVRKTSMPRGERPESGEPPTVQARAAGRGG